MAVFPAKIRKWGSSMGIIIPKKIMEKEDLKQNQQVSVFIIKHDPHVLRSTFGTLPKGKKSTQEIMDEIDEGWD